MEPATKNDVEFWAIGIMTLVLVLHGDLVPFILGVWFFIILLLRIKQPVEGDKDAS